MKSTHSLGLLGERLHHRSAFLRRKPVFGKHVLHLAGFFVRDFLDLALLAQALAGIVLGVALGGQVPAQSHGDGAGRDLGQSGDDHQAAVVDGAGNSGGQREGHSQPVGHSNDHVADNFAGREVTFNVRCLRHELPVPDGT